MINTIIETCASFVESLIWITESLHFSGALKARGKNWLKFLIGGIINTLLVFGLNQINLFSFVTPVAVIVFFTLYSKIVGKERMLVCVTSSVVVVTAMASIDYVLFFSFGIISENPIVDALTFHALMSPGLLRYLYLITAKAAQAFFSIVVVRKLPSLNKLRRPHIILLLVVSSAFYIMMTYLVSMILSASVLVLQTAVILSLVFIFACIIVLLVVCSLSAEYLAEKETNQLLSTVNALTEENYRKLSALQKELSRRNHDFAKHIQTIYDLASDDRVKETVEYAGALLRVPAERATLCKSGNAVIDSIINSKVSEAREKQIIFHFRVNFSIPTNISSVDICTILGNQLDNAFEACLKIPNDQNRQVDVHIYQQVGSVAVFEVSNTVFENPFVNNGDLHTTKENTKSLHGLGLQNIRETAEKYQGILENAYRNNRFVSSVLLYFVSQKSETQEHSEEK